MMMMMYVCLSFSLNGLMDFVKLRFFGFAKSVEIKKYQEVTRSPAIAQQIGMLFFAILDGFNHHTSSRLRGAPIWQICFRAGY